ncbi:hypothetical protein [Streptomyces sp. NPDC003943]
MSPKEKKAPAGTVRSAARAERVPSWAQQFPVRRACAAHWPAVTR